MMTAVYQDSAPFPPPPPPPPPVRVTQWWERSWVWILATLAVLGVGALVAAAVDGADEADRAVSTDEVASSTEQPALPPTAAPAETTVPSNVGPITRSDNEEHPPTDDVQLEACTSSEFGGPTATGMLTNNSSKLSNYVISVNFTDDAGVIVAQGTSYTTNIPAGATATWEAISFGSDVVASSCSVVTVDRMSAVG